MEGCGFRTVPGLSRKKSDGRCFATDANQFAAVFGEDDGGTCRNWVVGLFGPNVKLTIRVGKVTNGEEEGILTVLLPTPLSIGSLGSRRCSRWTVRG